jgi:hypothetical protein
MQKLSLKNTWSDLITLLKSSSYFYYFFYNFLKNGSIHGRVWTNIILLDNQSLHTILLQDSKYDKIKKIRKRKKRHAKPNTGELDRVLSN